MQTTGVIIVAGGSGQRCGGSLPKQFRLLGGQPVLARTINVFAQALPGAPIVVVLPASRIAFWKDLAARFDVAAHTLCEGGAERFHSVRNGLAALPDEVELIAVQDGVRPLGTPELILRTLAAAAEYGAAIPVTIPVDSFRETEPDEADTAGSGTADSGIDGATGQDSSTAQHGIAAQTAGIVPSRILDRRRLRIVQTPQVFRAELLRTAYRAEYSDRFTDDASVAEQAGYPVFLTEGERTNLKITDNDDFTLAEALLAARENAQTDNDPHADVL